MSYVSKGLAFPRAIVSSYGDGNYNTNGTSDQVELQRSLDDLTSGRDWNETVYWRGNFTIDDTIVVPSYTTIRAAGKMTLANNSDCVMIEGANDNVAGIDHTHILGDGVFEMDGNELNQTGTGTTINGIQIRADGLGGNKCRFITVENVYFKDIKDISLSLRHTTDFSRVENIRLEGNDGWVGIQLDNYSDSLISMIFITSCPGIALYLINPFAVMGDNFYLGGSSGVEAANINRSQMYVTSGQNCQFSNIKINDTNSQGLQMDGHDNTKFSNLSVTRVVDDNTYNGVDLDNCDQITLNPLFIGHKSTGSDWAVGLHLDASTTNFFGAGQIDDSTTTITDLGTYNDTSLIHTYDGPTYTYDVISSDIITRRNTGSDVGPWPRINFIEGANVTITLASDGTDYEHDVTIAASSGGAGTTSQWFPVTDANTYKGDYPSITLPDGVESAVRQCFVIPESISSIVDAQVIVIPDASGNLDWEVLTDFAQTGELYNNNSDSTTGTTAVTIGELEPIDISAALTGATAKDIVGISFLRDGDDASDTVNDDVHFLGIWIRGT